MYLIGVMKARGFEILEEYQFFIKYSVLKPEGINTWIKSLKIDSLKI